MSTERVDRATHHDSTDPVSVTTHARERECNGSSALGEVPVEGLSDRGSTPLASTNKIARNNAVSGDFYFISELF